MELPYLNEKNLAEAAFEQRKTILRWIVDTWSFAIHQPENKFIA